MGRTLGRLLVVAAIAIPAVLGESAAVIAAVRHISDHDGGGVGGANATRIDLYPRFDNTRIVTQIFGRFRHSRLNAVELWLDTDFADAGPEYRVAWLLGGDGDGVLDLALIHVDGFHDLGERVSCRRMYGAKHLDRRYVEVSVRHNCIGAPARFRITATTWNFTEYDSDGDPLAGFADGIPAYRRFTTRTFVAGGSSSSLSVSPSSPPAALNAAATGPRARSGTPTPLPWRATGVSTATAASS